MNWFDNKHICPLYCAENDLVQILLSKFTLYRDRHHAQLELAFDRDAPAIRRREAKIALAESMPNFAVKAAAYQQILDDVLLNNLLEVFEHDDADFAFRYANGGALPLLKIEGVDYYCLFYREVNPIGWNIANGGSDSWEELVNPVGIIERELREELIILDSAHKREYVLRPKDHRLTFVPEFIAARELWQKRFPHLDFRRFEQVDVCVDWTDGPDFLVVRTGSGEPWTFSGCFLNVNAIDFGIEIDKIASIELNEEVILLDGEIHGGTLLNRPIGLFEVKKLEREIEDGAMEHFPDLLYYSGRPCPPKEVRKMVETKFIPRLVRESLLDKSKARQLESEPDAYKLCPVTKQIIRRQIGRRKYVGRRAPSLSPRIFISYSAVDHPFAEQLYRELTKHGMTCWFAPESLRIGDRIRETIDGEIRRGDRILVVLSDASINSSWVEAEVEAALEEERQRNKTMLCPIRIDDSIMRTEKSWAAHIRRTRNIGDFSQSTDSAKYAQAINRLLSDLLVSV